MSRWIRYFAYGSNLHPARLRARTPSCRRVGVATLAGYALRFNHASSTDASAKCNIVVADDSVVHGVVYDLLAAERAALDRAEDLGVGYDLVDLSVSLDGREQPVFCYVGLPHTLDDSLRPFRWYRDIVLHGARQHVFPVPYLDAIAATPVIEDPDSKRDAYHRALLDIHEPLSSNR